nr:MAG TPA: hypothetical protein [Caudoviricetes sp.]
MVNRLALSGHKLPYIRLKSSIYRLFRHSTAEVGDFFLLFEKLFESYEIVV